MRKLACFILLVAVILLNACSDGGSDSPSDTNAHPASWFSTHPSAALATANFSDCTGCHGNQLQGVGDAVSCYRCHSYNETPPFSTHPPDWSDPFVDHRPYTTLNGPQSCKACHGSNLTGYQSAPSCFSATFEGLNCHPDGPQGAPHPVNGTYLLGSNHGPDAKADLTYCQQCHGQSGGPGTNPRFNIGINSAAGSGCESCHGIYYAHPNNWAGPNNTFHYTSGNIQNACSLCHGVNLDGVGGVGVSCLGCHDSVTAFTLDCAFCHGYPPDGSPDVATTTGVDHSEVPLRSHLECTICHGMSASSNGDSFEPVPNYNLFDYDTDTNGDHWNGFINMNSGTAYNQDNYGCDAALCHGNVPEFRLTDSGIPVQFGDYFNP
jgi:hypothetical protein